MDAYIEELTSICEDLLVFAKSPHASAAERAKYLKAFERCAEAVQVMLSLGDSLSEPTAGLN